MVFDDNSGLLIVDVRKRNFYQLRRSYNTFFDAEDDQYIIEVFYNVKNYSSEKDLDYQWQSFLELKDKPGHYKINGDWSEKEVQKITDLDGLGQGF